MSGGAGVAAVHFVDEVVDGVGHAGYLRGDAGLVGAESLGLPLDRVEGRHDEIELAAVVRQGIDGGLDGRQPGLEGGVLVVEDALDLVQLPLKNESYPDIKIIEHPSDVDIITFSGRGWYGLKRECETVAQRYVFVVNFDPEQEGIDFHVY